MIDDILGVMEEIVSALFRAAENIREFATCIFYCLAFLLILAATPLWILPYMIWKARKENESDSDDGEDWDSYTSATR